MSGCRIDSGSPFRIDSGSPSSTPPTSSFNPGKLGKVDELFKKKPLLLLTGVITLGALAFSAVILSGAITVPTIFLITATGIGLIGIGVTIYLFKKGSSPKKSTPNPEYKLSEICEDKNSGKAREKLEKLLKQYESHSEYQPFIQGLEKVIQNRGVMHVATQRRLDSKTVVLNDDALRAQAAHYKRKYGVTIDIIDKEELGTKIEKLKQSREVINIGFAININKDSTGGHLIPILVHVQPTSSSQAAITCVVMDVAGYLSKTTLPLIQTLKELKVRVLDYRGPPRQADSFSCRIGAMILLCNALLSFNHGDSTAYLRRFSNARPSEDPLYAEFFSIPLEWAAVEQIIPEKNRKNIDTITTHIRDRYSKNEAKRTRPRTIKALRESHRKQVRMEYTLFLFPPTPITIAGTPPPGITIEGNEIRFVVEENINDYLFNKGHRLVRTLNLSLRPQDEEKEGQEKKERDAKSS